VDPAAFEIIRDRQQLHIEFKDFGSVLSKNLNKCIQDPAQ
jgi:hypothetical protein